MLRFSLVFRMGALIAMVVVLIGCGAGKTSPIPRFYLLSPTSSSQDLSPNDSKDYRATVGVANIHIPEYLARPQIVTRIGASRISLAEFDRWAEPLSGQLVNVVIENLSQLLSRDRIRVVSMRHRTRVDHKLNIEITQMDGALQVSLTLVARWILTEPHPGGEALRTKQGRFTEPLNQTNYEALVIAHNRAISQLCREITEDIRSLARH